MLLWQLMMINNWKHTTSFTNQLAFNFKIETSLITFNIAKETIVRREICSDRLGSLLPMCACMWTWSLNTYPPKDPDYFLNVTRQTISGAFAVLYFCFDQGKKPVILIIVMWFGWYSEQKSTFLKTLSHLYSVLFTWILFFEYFLLFFVDIEPVSNNMYHINYG